MTFFCFVLFYASSDLLMACRTMQLRFFKLGTVLTYAFIKGPGSSVFPLFFLLFFFFLISRAE